MPNVLVTGGAGFVGFALARSYAEQGATVTILDNFSRGREDQEFNDVLASPNVRLVQADMTKKDFYSELDAHYDAVHHLAAINGTKFFYEKPFEVLKINFLILLNMLEWATPENCGRFLFSSSGETYAATIRRFGDVESFIPTEESVPLCVDDVFNERFSYGGSKIMGEQLAIHYCNSRHVPYSIVRFHNIYGPRMGYEHVIPEFCLRVYNQESPFKIFGGDETRAFCYVSDCVDALQRVVESDACLGQVINVGNDTEEIPIKEMASKLMTIVGQETAFDIQPAPKGCVKRRCPNISKLKSLTGFEPKVSLDEGLKLTYDWYMAAYEKRAKENVNT